MSIKYGLLALLEQEPMHGYQLRTEFDAATGATWPLNVGQVYTTLARLERDGFVRSLEEDADGRARYEITERGRTELGAWFESPVFSSDRPRDELAIKLALAVGVPGVDVGQVIQSQRAATVVAMQDLTRLKRGVDDLSWELVLESMRFQLEAEMRWLDHCESSIARHRSARDPAGPAEPHARPSTTAGKQVSR